MRYGIRSDEDEQELRDTMLRVHAQGAAEKQELLDAGFTDECFDCGANHLYPTDFRCPDCGRRRRWADGRWLPKPEPNGQVRWPREV